MILMVEIVFGSKIVILIWCSGKFDIVVVVGEFFNMWCFFGIGGC